MVMRVGVEQREVEVLSAPGALAVQQRRADRAHRMRARGDVAQRHHRKDWRPTLLAAHRRDPRVRRAHPVEARFLRQRARLPEGGNRAHHQPRIELAHHVVAES